MNIILVSRRHGKSRTIALNNRALTVLASCLALVAASLVYAGIKWSNKEAPTAIVSETVVKQWQLRLDEQQQVLESVSKDSAKEVDALTLRLGEMQARLMRLDALGQRLTEAAKLKKGEFDFESTPALGGPEQLQSVESYSMIELQENLARIEQQIEDREQQLDVLDQLLVNRKIQSELFIAGRPIKWGWLSSRYGYRSDPFTGKRAWHAGVDFAGKEGSDIISVGAGVVTYASDRYGYGNLVEINHGGGVVTRYGHCKEILVKVGDVVEKGKVVAKMGSTGRSTGPHVHFEVIKNGKSLNPERYIHRASR